VTVSHLLKATSLLVEASLGSGWRVTGRFKSGKELPWNVLGLTIELNEDVNKVTA